METYIWFTVKWTLISAVVFILCGILFFSPHPSIGLLLILLCISFFVLDAIKLTRRGKNIIRRAQ
jgi:Na+/melibiose symporter-like transporter